MKLINNRLYLDYNATAPLAKSVINWFPDGALLFANPSSIHSSGKRAKKLITRTSEYLKNVFTLNNHELFFHSGATEAINTIIKGFCMFHMTKNDPFHVVAMATDHSSVVNQKEHVELLGGKFHTLDVFEDGSFNESEIIDYINSLEGKVLFNFTHINNETGVISPLSLARSVKLKTNCIVHVDAVQTVGKSENELILMDEIDFYTFSGHKFGSMKGVGFTFALDCHESWCPLIRGGGQQSGMRSGTENTHGIYSLKLALEEVLENQNSAQVRIEKDYIENKLISTYGDKIQVVAFSNSNRNSNTAYFVINDVKIEVLLTAFDMASIDLSSGSACSSGIVKPSRVLMAMGFEENLSKNGVRISLPTTIEAGAGEEIFSQLHQVLQRFI